MLMGSQGTDALHVWVVVFLPICKVRLREAADSIQRLSLANDTLYGAQPFITCDLCSIALQLALLGAPVIRPSYYLPS